MAVPYAGTTKFFGQIVDNIYADQAKKSHILVTEIYDALIDGTPRTTGTGSPVDTGALKANWNMGIRPNKRFIKKPKDGSSVPLKKRTVKPYGKLETFYIWNNTPYLAEINSGIAGRHGKTPGAAVNIKFIEKAISIGEMNARNNSNVVSSRRKAVAISNIKAQSFF